MPRLSSYNLDGALVLSVSGAELRRRIAARVGEIEAAIVSATAEDERVERERARLKAAYKPSEPGDPVEIDPFVERREPHSAHLRDRLQTMTTIHDLLDAAEIYKVTPADLMFIGVIGNLAG